MNLHDVIRAGRSGFIYTLLSISFAMAMGMLLGRLWHVPTTAAYLISTGTAICGGSAIAAVGPITGASDEEMAVSLGTVFVLNSVARHVIVIHKFLEGIEDGAAQIDRHRLDFVQDDDTARDVVQLSTLSDSI